MTLGGLLFFAQVARANVGIGPIFYLMLPYVSIITARLTFGISLILIIAIEALVLWIRGRLSAIKSLILSLVANIFSMLIGVGIYWSLRSIFTMIAVLIGGTLLFAYMFISICKRTDFHSNLISKRIPHWVFYILSFLVFPLLCIAMGFVMSHIPYDYLYGNISSLVPGLAWGGLLLIGFVLTIISEGFIVIRFVPKNHPKIISTVVLMNALSYAVLMSVLGILMLKGRFPE